MTTSTDKTAPPCGDRCEEQDRRPAVRPAYRVGEHETGITLSIALPGVRKEDLTVTASENILTVGAERSDTVPEEWKPCWEHPAPERYELRVRLHPTLDPSKIEAALEHGVLRLGIERRAEAVARSISVN